MAGNDNPFSTIEQLLENATNEQDPKVMGNTAIAAVRAVITGDPAEADAARINAAEA